MPKWLPLLLRWGGPALAVIFAIPLFVIGPMGPHLGTPGVDVVPETTDAPLLLYWIFVMIGVVAGFVGWLISGRRPGGGG
mgnify:CR=1 FL=1